MLEDEVEDELEDELKDELEDELEDEDPFDEVAVEDKNGGICIGI